MGKNRIAVVSTDGITVDQHFGKADHFLIFDSDDPSTLVEKRETEPLSVGDPDHRFDAEKFDRIAARLGDCSKIYTVKIGALPAAKLRDKGIEPVEYAGAVADIGKG